MIITIHGNSLGPDIFKGLPSLNNDDVTHLVLPGHKGRPIEHQTSFLDIVESARRELLLYPQEDLILVGFSLGGHIVHHLLKFLKPKKIITIAAPPLEVSRLNEVFVPHEILRLLFTPNHTQEELDFLATQLAEGNQIDKALIKDLIQQTDPKLRGVLAGSMAQAEIWNELELLRAYSGEFHHLFSESDPILNRDYIKSLNLKNLHWIKGGHLTPLLRGEMESILQKII